MRIANLFKPDKSYDTFQLLQQQSILKEVNNVPGYNNYAYPNMCLGFAAPSSWILEDAAANFSGSELDIIKRYEAEAETIINSLHKKDKLIKDLSEGVKIVLVEPKNSEWKSKAPTHQI